MIFAPKYTFSKKCGKKSGKIRGNPGNISFLLQPLKKKVLAQVEENPKMNFPTAAEKTKFFTKETNVSLLTAFLFKPNSGVQWLPEDLKFSRICSPAPLMTEVNIHTFGEILILYSILLSLISLNNDILD